VPDSKAAWISAIVASTIFKVLGECMTQDPSGTRRLIPAALEAFRKGAGAAVTVASTPSLS
jgi:hypothetical protein